MKKSANSPLPTTDPYVNTPYEEKQLSTAIINSGQKYQRPVEMPRVNKIKDHYDPKILMPPVVSFRDGKFYLVDGQHRIVALKLLNGGNDVIVTCRVIFGLTYKQEAALYEALDAANRRLRTGDRIRAQIESGGNKDVSDIQKVLHANHIEWSFKNHGAVDGQTSATRALLNAYNDLGFEAFQRMVQLIWLTWKGDRYSLTAYIISGMALFVGTYGKEIIDENFVKRLSKCHAEGLIASGKTDISTRNTALRFARVILGRYNYKQCKNVLGYKFNG